MRSDPMKDLAAVRELSEDATPGVWSVDETERDRILVVPADVEEYVAVMFWNNTDAQHDAAFVVAAVNFIREHGATVEGLWEERERLQATLNNTLAERDAAEHVAQSSRISAIDAESRATRAEAALKEAGAWRPIAEAPRDGTWILLYDPGYKNPYLHAQFRRGAWWGQLTPSGRAVVWNAPPYWQPLPDAPQDVTDV
jgi:hypothetical protein